MSNKVLRITFALVLAMGIALAVVNRQAFDVSALEIWVKNAGSAGPVLSLLYNLTGATLSAALAAG